MRSFLPLLAVVLAACGSPSDATGSGDAWVQGMVSQVSHEASLDANGRALCQFSAPGAADPRVRLDTLLGFARFGQAPALQVVDLRERPSL